MASTHDAGCLPLFGRIDPGDIIEQLAGTNVVLVEKVSANVSLMSRITQAPTQYREHASGVSKK